MLVIFKAGLYMYSQLHEQIEVTGIYSGVVIQYERLAKLSAISGVAATC